MPTDGASCRGRSSGRPQNPRRPLTRAVRFGRALPHRLNVEGEFAVAGLQLWSTARPRSSNSSTSRSLSGLFLPVFIRRRAWLTLLALLWGARCSPGEAIGFREIDRSPLDFGAGGLESWGFGFDGLIAHRTTMEQASQASTRQSPERSGPKRGRWSDPAALLFLYFQNVSRVDDRS